jgi:3'(2'), 5'-bisphosphate nucleotidase
LATDVERDAGVAAVRAAMALADRAQGRLLAGDTLTKDDTSPVTVADFAVQALVASVLTDSLGEIRMIGEETSADLASEAQSALRAGVATLVSHARGTPSPERDVLGWLDLGDATTTQGRVWTLDPIDGTKGFLRGDQYAIALALLVDGQVVFGALGCPNLPNGDGSRGALFVAHGGLCTAETGGAPAVPVRVASPASLRDARVCESVEAAHSDHDASARIVARLGIDAEPYRIDSQCKYGAVARGDASIYLRLPTRPGYVERIWDHAAGAFVVEQAGGRVTDVDGRPLDFAHGRGLSANRGVVATDGRFHDEILAAITP